jgi:hypothetical protein
MAEPQRIDDEITTADIAGQSQKSRESSIRPSLLRNEARTPESPSSTVIEDEARDSVNRNPTTLAGTHAIPLTRGEAVPAHDETARATNQSTPLFVEGEVTEFRSRWADIQTGFVDEPRQAVQDADNLVASLMKKLAEGFASERQGLEHQWDRGEDVSTEDLRVALQRYRSFFDRLLRV